jgi:hypothetical protein
MAHQKALPPTLAPRLISRQAAAAYVNVSPTTFDEDGEGRRDAQAQAIERALWRAGQSALERAEATARWTRNAKKLAETNPGTMKGGKQPGDKGVNKSARKLGLTRETIRRALKIDGISPEAKQAAKKRGLDRNQDALLKVAKESTPEQQVGKVRELTTKPAPKKLSKAERKQLSGLMRRLKKATNLRREISNASPFVCRKFAAAIVKLGRSSAPNKSQLQ